MVDITVDLSKLGGAIEDDVERHVRRMITVVFTALDSASPIGRPSLWKRPKPPKGYKPGWFKANWRVVFGSQPTDEPLDLAARIKIKPNVKLYRLKTGAWIINNVPYAEPLASGHSKQAPLGWIDNAIRGGIRSAG